MVATAAVHFPDRVRFNWGYHDGAQPHARSVNRHYDRVYFAGYNAGVTDRQNGDYCDGSTSDAAWKRHSSPAAKMARRMARYR